MPPGGHLFAQKVANSALQLPWISTSLCSTPSKWCMSHGWSHESQVLVETVCWTSQLWQSLMQQPQHLFCNHVSVSQPSVLQLLSQPFRSHLQDFNNTSMIYLTNSCPAGPNQQHKQVQHTNRLPVMTREEPSEAGGLQRMSCHRGGHTNHPWGIPEIFQTFTWTFSLDGRSGYLMLLAILCAKPM